MRLTFILALFSAQVLLREISAYIKYDCDCNAPYGAKCYYDEECLCQKGYAGKYCHEDVDECVPPNGGGLCSGQEYCNNLFGSYECVCMSGYVWSDVSNSCVPCSENYAGKKCAHHDCPCVNGTCDSQGQCMCAQGWEGERCDRSFDDCLRADCSATTQCIDRHRHFVCFCGKQQLYSRKECHDIQAILARDDRSNPIMGDIIDVYLLYNISYKYRNDPNIHRDFTYRVGLL